MDPANSKEHSGTIERASPGAAAEEQWIVVGRWQEYAGEVRANLLRIAGVGGFYLIELLNYYGLHLGPLDLPASVELEFHQTMTAIVVAWTMMSLATLLCLQLRIFPAWLKYATTLGDVILLTATLMIADGPRSPLTVGYFLIIVLSGLRFQLPLVWCATASSMLGYLCVAWAAIVPGTLADRRLAVPGYYQLIMLLALALAGVVLGQIVRRVRAMAVDLLRRVETHAGRPQP
ncbi:MAG: hypothetical protein DWQ37_13610 [Planctomycetota bacterium]|nr:MAG: hypothetical protein DWQ37_13610 [Planctomycetota bacterium]